MMRLVLVHAFLIAQILAPASYYLWRDDPRDERFAWRMFSSMRFDACSIRFFAGEDQEPFDARAEMSPLLFAQMREGRQSLIQQYVGARCARMQRAGEPADVRVQLTCRRLGDTTLQKHLSRDRNLCP